MQPVSIKLLITLAAVLVSLMESRWDFAVSRTIRLKRSRFCYLAIPMLCPDTVGVAQPRRPGKHRLAKVDADRVAEQSQRSLRILQHVSGIDNGRNAHSSVCGQNQKSLPAARTRGLLAQGLLAF